MYAVASDHDSLQGHPAERWLRDANISHISEDEIKYIESFLYFAGHGSNCTSLPFLTVKGRLLALIGEPL
jgi:hypothetical protein